MKKGFIILVVIIFAIKTNGYANGFKNNSSSFFSDWEYKGYIGFTPLYLGGNGFNLGFGVDGEISFPKYITFYGAYSRNYYELDRGSKRGYMSDFGIELHPFQWHAEANYPTSVLSYFKTSSDGGRSWSDTKSETSRYKNREESLKRVLFRGGMINYRYLYKYKTTRNEMHYDVNSSAFYAGIGYSKVAINKGYRRQYSLDYIIQNSIEIPNNKLLQDSCTLQTGVRFIYSKSQGMGGGTYEFGMYPGVKKDPYYYFKIGISINAVFTKGFKW